jgi:hypothetical protein
MKGQKRKEFSSFTLSQALALLQLESLEEWLPQSPPVEPSAFHLERMQQR